MKVVVAPDAFGGSLRATDAAAAIADGWTRARPDDEVVLAPMSDGGEGLLDAVTQPGDTLVEREVAGPLGHPIEATLLLRRDERTAVIESALACGTALLAADRGASPQGRPVRGTPMLTTTYGVGELLDAAREAGARQVLIGLGGSASVDGGAGALSGLGFRLRVADGGGLKIGGGQLHQVVTAEPGWVADWHGVAVELLADVTTTLADAAAVFGPQKGSSPGEVAVLRDGLEVWADVTERDLADGSRHRDQPGSGAAGGLGFGLACGIGARTLPGAAAVAELVGLDDALEDAEVVLTGEGRLDATTAAGKVVDHVATLGRSVGARVGVIAGQAAPDAPSFDAVELSAPQGAGDDPGAEVAGAAARLARRW